MNRTVLGLGGVLVGRADNLASSQAAAGQQCAGHTAPVIPSGFVVDFGCASKLPPYNDRHILVQASIVQVFHQGRDTLVQHGHVLSPAFEVAAVPIPAAEGQRDTTCACLDQPPCHQEVFHQPGATVGHEPGIPLAISFDDSWILLTQVKSLGQPG